MEDQIENTIAGIGLNINQKKFISDAPNPVSLSMITGIIYDLNDCMAQVASDLDRRYKQLISQDIKQIKHEYNSLLYHLNEWHNLRDVSGIFSGRIISVTDNGKLKIENKSRRINEYSYKEIEFSPR
jgi:BirA family biotin operon repressor/biotin-[acetyl-CoA-carboxylase] ligase